ncbi:MAG: methyltransferase family protein [Blastocatellia bacterium]
MTMPRKSPGVHFPPPILYVIGFGIGWLLNRAWPFPLFHSMRSAGGWFFGWLLIGLALILLAAALVTFLRHRTGIYPNQPAAAIVRDGPYRFSRNPMYVALTILYLGIVLLTHLLWPLLLLPLVILVLQKAVIQREERYLKDAFGEAYEQYCRQVRRWL